MHPSILPLSRIFELNTMLFANTFDGVDTDSAQRRIDEQTNSMAFLACHLLDARYYLLKLLGRSETCPFQSLFDGANSIDDFTEYPPLPDLLSCWDTVSALLEQALSNVAEDSLVGESPLKTPCGSTLLDTLTFLAEHESYHIGQLGFLRKYLGYSPMSYK